MSSKVPKTSVTIGGGKSGNSGSGNVQGTHGNENNRGGSGKKTNATTNVVDVKKQPQATTTTSTTSSSTQPLSSSRSVGIKNVMDAPPRAGGIQMKTGATAGQGMKAAGNALGTAVKVAKTATAGKTFSNNMLAFLAGVAVTGGIGVLMLNREISESSQNVNRQMERTKDGIVSLTSTMATKVNHVEQEMEQVMGEVERVLELEGKVTELEKALEEIREYGVVVAHGGKGVVHRRERTMGSRRDKEGNLVWDNQRQVNTGLFESIAYAEEFEKPQWIQRGFDSHGGKFGREDVVEE